MLVLKRYNRIQSRIGMRWTIDKDVWSWQTGGLRARGFEYFVEFVSFYEWQTLAGGVKQPYYIYMKDAVKKEEDDVKTPIKPAHAHLTRQPMFFAAIYEHSLVHEDVGAR